MSREFAPWELALLHGESLSHGEWEDDEEDGACEEHALPGGGTVRLAGRRVIGCLRGDPRL